MKNRSLQLLTVAIVAAVGLTACDGLGKMIKNANKVVYEVNPKPMEMHGDTISVTVSGKYPAKFFAKKVALIVTPTIKYNGGEKALKPQTMVGEKSTVSGTKIGYDKGGSFSYTDKVAYMPGMDVATLEVKASGSVGTKKPKDFPAMKIADGTIVTPLLVKSDEKPMMGKDDFKKSYPVTSTGNIYYVVNQSGVRPGELNNADMKVMKEWLAMTTTNPNYSFKGVSVSAYASPDGEMALNADLANDRAASGSKAMMGIFKEKKTKLEAGTKDDFYNKVTTAEDWDGFKSAIEASSNKAIVADRDLILRVLTMYSDLQVREKEIKNLSKTYTQISDDILPKLRRSVLTINADKMSRTDDQIMKLAVSTPDSLSNEELMYAADALSKDMNEQLAIYKATERMYPNDWRAINNAGCIYLMQNKTSDAQAQFDKAAKVAPNQGAVKNNQGILARWKGDRKTAADMYKAAGGSAEANYNMGIVDIMNGNYSSAVSNMGTFNTFNTALAKVLNGSPDAAAAIIDQSPDKDTALGFYLRAIIGSRTGKNDMMINNLKLAIDKDASYKSKAKDDCEFLKSRGNADFKALVN